MMAVELLFHGRIKRLRDARRSGRDGNRYFSVNFAGLLAGFFVSKLGLPVGGGDCA